MAGLSGLVRPPGLAKAEAEYPYPRILVKPQVTLWLAPRRGAPSTSARRTDPAPPTATAGALTLALHGHAHDPRSGRRLDAESLLALWIEEGRTVLDRLEGAFHIALLNRMSGSFQLINDRLGVLPLFWRADASSFAFAPRIADLPGPFVAWQPDPAGVVTFLANGYCLGTRTLVENVSHLAPAEIVTVDLNTMARTHSTYWDLHYDPDHGASPTELSKGLYDAINEAFTLLVPAEGEATGLFLSGGWDCRALLGAAERTGRKPAAVITNGASDELPGTDTAMARHLAGKLGLPYRFCRRDPALGPRLALDGIARCELRTDTCPEVFGQHQVPLTVFSGLEAVLKGDEIWGWRDDARDEDQAISNVMPNRLGPSLLAALAPDLRAEADGLRRAEIAAVWQGCDAQDWVDRKDYLYLKGRVSRYIFGLGGSDEEHVRVLRPFLTRNVMEIVRRMPAPMRIQKNLFLEMLARHEPKLFRLGRNHGGHIADYYFHMAPFIRERAAAYLRDGWDLAGLLDRDAAIGLLAGFDPRESPPAAAPGGRQRLRNWLLDRRGWRWYRTRYYRDRSARATRTWHPGEASICFRVWLLAEMFAGRS